MMQIDCKETQKINKTYMRDLIQLIEEKPYILEIICRIQLILKMLGNQSDSLTEKQMVDKQFQIFQIEEDITNEEKDKFMNIFRQLNSHDYGLLLEYLVQSKGPYKMEKEEVKYSLQSRVYHESIHSNHNFDVIFYMKKSKKVKNTGRIIIDGEAEFHECKNNILNWIPDNKNELSKSKNFRKASRKLEFCKEVHNLLLEGYMYIPTFCYNVRGKQACLNSMGYDFIQILNISELINAFF